MESSRGGQNGIQLLLAAEQEAQHIVNTARTAKQARLKQAKEEAEKEIAEFRAYMEAEFQRKIEQTSGDSGANVKRLELETDEKIEHLKTEASRVSSDVVKMLLRHVTTSRDAFAFYGFEKIFHSVITHQSDTVQECNIERDKEKRINLNHICAENAYGIVVDTGRGAATAIAVAVKPNLFLLHHFLRRS
ncbi:V-type proton ATPase subunit G 2 [Capsicum annuum]|nr:V-type proton ATPase subunit G 2 [Capsicum annuum]